MQLTAIDRLFFWAWTSGPRACGRRLSTRTVERSRSGSRRSRRPIRGRPGPSSSRSSGGRPPATRSGSPWPRMTSTPGRSPASASTARPAPSWPATRPASPSARPCSGWISGRSARPTRSATRAIRSLRYVSGRVSPEWMLPKALWLKRNEPEVYDRAERIVECTDWMMFHLTGEWTLSLNHVAVKWNYARPDGGWPVGLLKAVGLDDLLEKWPDADRAAGQGRGTPERTGGPRPGAARRESRSPKGGSTPTWECSAWGRRKTATWP